MPQHDLIVVGAGIVGLAHALAAVRRGKRVLVLDRDGRANGASIRNFGFVTVAGQERGRVWDMAMRSAGIWREVAAAAGIRIEQEGSLLTAQRGEAEALLHAFLATEMGDGCSVLGAAQIKDRWPMIRNARAALWSPHDVRVDSTLAIPRLAAWLAETHAVDIRWGVTVHGIEGGLVHSTLGMHEADAVIVCPGDDGGLFPEVFAQAGITRCKLQMLRLAAPGWQLPAPMMSDLSMIRNAGFAALAEAHLLRARLETEEAAALANGVHMVAVQGADGSMVVGDSHHYAPTPDPFGSAEVDDMILAAYAQVLGPPPPVLGRWMGTYASASGHSLVASPEQNVRLVVVTGGTGASTGFGLGEDVIAGLYGSQAVN